MVRDYYYECPQCGEQIYLDIDEDNEDEVEQESLFFCPSCSCELKVLHLEIDMEGEVKLEVKMQPTKIKDEMYVQNKIWSQRGYKEIMQVEDAHRTFDEQEIDPDTSCKDHEYGDI